MTRSPLTVISGLPYRVTQRGNCREAISFENGNQEIDRDHLAEQAREAGIEVRAVDESRDNSLLLACCRSAHRLS
jgi:hypothetical protein